MMPNLKALLDAGERLITEHASAAVLEKHLALVNAQLKVAVEENERLKQRVAQLESLTGNLTGELKAKAIGEEFEEENGVLFKRHPRGGYHKVPYCPKCRSPLGALNSGMPFCCTQSCGFLSSIYQDEIPKIIQGLPA